MNEFMQKQFEMSEKLLNAMVFDQKQRIDQYDVWAVMNAELLKKIDRRDKIIAELRAKLQAYEASEAL